MKTDRELAKHAVAEYVRSGKMSKEEGDMLLERIESGECEIAVAKIEAGSKGAVKALRHVLRGIHRCQKFDDELLDSAMASAFLGGLAVGMGVKKKHRVTIAQFARIKFDEYMQRHDRAVEQQKKEPKH